MNSLSSAWQRSRKQSTALFTFKNSKVELKEINYTTKNTSRSLPMNKFGYFGYARCLNFSVELLIPFLFLASKCTSHKARSKHRWFTIIAANLPNLHKDQTWTLLNTFWMGFQQLTSLMLVKGSKSLQQCFQHGKPFQSCYCCKVRTKSLLRPMVLKSNVQQEHIDVV